MDFSGYPVIENWVSVFLFATLSTLRPSSLSRPRTAKFFFAIFLLLYSPLGPGRPGPLLQVKKASQFGASRRV